MQLKNDLPKILLEFDEYASLTAEQRKSGSEKYFFQGRTLEIRGQSKIWNLDGDSPSGMLFFAGKF